MHAGGDGKGEQQIIYTSDKNIEKYNSLLATLNMILAAQNHHETIDNLTATLKHKNTRVFFLYQQALFISFF